MNSPQIEFWTMETQKVKRRRLFLDEGVTADENRQTGERLERASTSKNDDALEGQNYVEQSKVPIVRKFVCPFCSVCLNINLLFYL